MKKLLIVSSFFFLYNSFAQIPFNATYHDKHEYPLNMAVMANDFFFLTNNGTPWLQFWEPRLYKYDKNGNLIYRKLFHEGFLTKIFMFASLDNKLIVAGNKHNCDVPDSSKIRSFITKLDAAGNAVFTTVIKLPYNSGSLDNFKAVLQHNDSSYFAFSDSLLYKFSKSGQFLFKKNLSVSGIQCASQCSDGNFLLSCKLNNQPAFYKVDPFGFFVQSAPALEYYNGIFQTSNGSFIGWNNQSLRKISGSFQTQQSLSGSINDVCFKNDTLYTIYGDATQLKYEVRDTSFTLAHSFTDLTGYSVGNAIVRSSQFTAILSKGSTALPNLSNNFSSLNVFPPLASFNYNRDIGVSSVVLDSLYSYATQQGMAPTLFTAGYKKAIVYVKNYGSTPVNMFNVNYFEYNDIACGRKFYQQFYSGAPLNPGDSMAVLTPSFVKSEYGFSSNHTLNFCFYTTTPDMLNDKVIQNDFLCKSVLVQSTGMKEHLLNGTKIFPNPIKDELNLVMVATEALFLKVYDALGKEISTETVPGDHGIKIVTSGLSPGVYFLRVHGLYGDSRTFKFIKAD